MRDKIQALYPALADAFKADYARWNDACNSSYRGTYVVTFEEGPKYTRIVKSDTGQRSTLGFVCMVDTQKIQGNVMRQFKAGDLLKAAGWKAPALNFARGSIFDIDKAKVNGHIRWTGLA